MFSETFMKTIYLSKFLYIYKYIASVKTNNKKIHNNLLTSLT